MGLGRSCLNGSKIHILKRAIKFKYDEHISSIIRVPQKHLKLTNPNNPWPIVKMLEGLNRDTSHLIQKYGESLKNEILKVLENFDLKSFSQKDKEKVLNILNEVVKPELYHNRFSIMLNSIEARHRSYGLNFERDKYRIDIPKAICEVDSANLTRRIRAKIDMELDCLIQKYNKSDFIEEKTEEHLDLKPIAKAEEYLELKPNIMGVGININAIIRKLFGKKI